MENKDKEIHTEIMKARSRKYYFDVRETRSGDQYVTISETQPKSSNFKRMRVMVFAEYLDEFIESLNSLKEKVKVSEQAQESKIESERRYQEFLQAKDAETE